MFQSAAITEPVTVPRGRTLGSRWLGLCVGVWIGLFPFADLALRARIGILGGDVEEVGQASPLLTLVQTLIVAAGLVPILWGALALGADFRRAKLLALSAFLLCLSIPLSYISISKIEVINYVGLVYYVFLVCIIFVSINLDEEIILPALMSALAVVLGVAMVAALIDHDYAWGRLMGRTAPNYWGGLAMTAIILAIAMRGWIVRSALIVLALFVLFSAQSRGEMLSLVVALSVAAVLFTRHPRARRWTWLWFAAALGVVAVFGLANDYIFNNLLMLWDARRGLSSGITGRASAWRETWDMFAAHPWFGVGYHQHQQYLTSLSSAHEAYLASLADTGVVGFFGYMVFFIGALCRALIQAWRTPTAGRRAVAAFLTAYAITGLVEPAGLQTGNSLSMLMIVLACWAWREDVPAERRRDESLWAPARAAL